MTNFENYVCVCFLCLCRDWFCGLTWQKLYIWEVLKCTFAYDMVWLSLGDPLWLTWCWNPITNFCAVVSVNVGPWSAQWSVLLSGPGLCSGQCCCQALVCAVVIVAVRPWSAQWSVLLSGPGLCSGQCYCWAFWWLCPGIWARVVMLEIGYMSELAQWCNLSWTQSYSCRTCSRAVFGHATSWPSGATWAGPSLTAIVGLCVGMPQAGPVVQLELDPVLQLLDL